jgi:hypothetical protein
MLRTTQSLLLFVLATGGATAGEGEHLGVATCASTLCHGSARPLEARSVLQNEYVTWSHFDPHSRAYRVLLEQKGVTIARRLGLKSAHEAPECLACHTDAVAAEKRGARFLVEDGIGCEACHASAERWLASHDDTQSVSHQDNLANGLRALERPQVRAEVCVGCHVGDEKRFASHAMMAAGHPRLTFELDTYTELWRTSGGREHFRRDRDYIARKARFAPVQVWLDGLSASTARTAQLVEQRIAPSSSGFPDFALYNCYSCHRAMRVPAWEALANEQDAPPGSLRLHDGHARALLAVLEATAPADATALRRAQGSLHAAGGNLAAVREARQALDGTLSTIQQNVHRRTWSRSDLQAALDALVAAAKRGAFADYAAAEQAAMGMIVLLAELGPDASRAAAVDEMFQALEDDSGFDSPRFARALEVLGVEK